MFSWSYSSFYAPAFRILFYIEPQLTLFKAIREDLQGNEQGLAKSILVGTKGPHVSRTTCVGGKAVPQVAGLAGWISQKYGG
jgi:hypothetical protein